MSPNSIITVPLYMYHPCHPHHTTQSFALEPFTCHHHQHLSSSVYCFDLASVQPTHPIHTITTCHRPQSELHPLHVFNSTYMYHHTGPHSTRLAHFTHTHTHTHTQTIALTTLTTISIEDEHTPDAQTISHPSCCCSGRTCGACTAATRRSFDLQTNVGHSLRFTSIRTSQPKKDTKI